MDNENVTYHRTGSKRAESKRLSRAIPPFLVGALFNLTSPRVSVDVSLRVAIVAVHMNTVEDAVDVWVIVFL